MAATLHVSLIAALLCISLVLGSPDPSRQRQTTCDRSVTQAAVASCSSRSNSGLCTSTDSCQYGALLPSCTAATSCSRYTGIASYCAVASCVTFTIDRAGCVTDPDFLLTYVRHADAHATCLGIRSLTGCADMLAVEAVDRDREALACRAESSAERCTVDCLNASLAVLQEHSCGPHVDATASLPNVARSWSAACMNLTDEVAVCGTNVAAGLCDAAGAVAAVSFANTGDPTETDPPSNVAAESTDKGGGVSRTWAIVLGVLLGIFAIATCVLGVGLQRQAQRLRQQQQQQSALPQSMYHQDRRGDTELSRPISPVPSETLTAPHSPPALSSPASPSRGGGGGAAGAYGGGAHIDDRIRTSAVVQQLREGRWQRGRLLGKGSSGSVYLCVLNDGSFVAMKSIDAAAMGQSEVQRFARELRMMAGLRHESIVRYFYAAYDASDKAILLWMEYVHGGSLGGFVRKLDDRLSEAVVARYTVQILKGLQYLHDHRIVHRDIKADNLLIDSDGRVKLADFGSAREVATMNSHSAGHGNMQTIVGTPLWMAPEVVNPDHQYADNGGYGAKADIWSLGITVAELLNTGVPPWPDFESAWQALYHIGREDAQPTLPTHVSSLCHGFMLQCVRHDPRERPTANALLDHPWLAEAMRAQDLSLLAFLDEPDGAPFAAAAPMAHGMGGAGQRPAGLRPQFNGLDDEAATSLDAISAAYGHASPQHPLMNSSGFDEAIITVERQLTASRASSHHTVVDVSAGAPIGSRRSSVHSAVPHTRSGANIDALTDEGDATMLVHETPRNDGGVPPVVTNAQPTSYGRSAVTGNMVIHDLSDGLSDDDDPDGDGRHASQGDVSPGVVVLQTPVLLNHARGHGRVASEGAASNASMHSAGGQPQSVRPTRRAQRGSVQLNLELEADGEER